MREYVVEKENTYMANNHIEHFLQCHDKKRVGIRPHIHPAVEVLHIIEGEYRIFIDDKEYFLQTGDTVLIRANAIHRCNVLWDRPSSYYVMKFKPDFILNITGSEQSSSYLLAFSLVNAGTKTVWRKDECAQIAKAVRRLHEETQHPSYGSDIAIRICFATVILSLLRDINAVNPPADLTNDELVRHIYDAILYINQHYSENITAENCSKYVFLSYSYFSRNFKRITGRTFTDYLTMVRINHAEKELLSTKKPISQIAVECGFNNFAYFSAKYKKIKGVTPSQIRKE